MQAEANLIFSGISDATVKLGQWVLPVQADTSTEMLNTSALKRKHSMRSQGTGIQGFSPSTVHPGRLSQRQKRLSRSNLFLWRAF